jgi:phosphatidylserine synthase
MADLSVISGAASDSSSPQAFIPQRESFQAQSPSVEAGRSPRTIRTFGLKDVFTCINLLGGIFTIIFCIENNIRYAAYAFLLGYLLGDSLDGLVARVTKTGNAFGREFDAISDHLTQCIAPAFIVFVGYRDISYALAVVLASTLILTGSVRHARAAVVPVNFPMAYMGLPRTASAFIVVSFLNSTLINNVPGGHWLGAIFLVILSVAHILPLPFRTHRGRNLENYIRAFVTLFFVTTIVALLFFPKYVFDVTFVWLLLYALTSWIPFTPEERRAFFARAKEWSEQVRLAR